MSKVLLDFRSATSFTTMPETCQVRTPGDLEAVVLAESYDLLSSIVGPYTYRVSGEPGRHQAIFDSAETHALFYIRVHEFLADATHISSSPSVPTTLSLLSAGRWLSERHPKHAAQTGLRDAYQKAREWFDRTHRIAFWAPSIWRHLRLELPMLALIAMRANMEKHQLLRLNKEIARLRSRLVQSGSDVSLIDVVSARKDFYHHVRGMLEYHATEVAEHVAGCFLGLFRFVRELYVQNPTNILDAIAIPTDISDDVFRYMYASTIVGLGNWTEERIISSIPQTSPSLRGTYRQHGDWGVVDSEHETT